MDETGSEAPRLSTYERARELLATGKSPDEVKQVLMKELSLDEESSRIVVNSAVGQGPSALPEANVSLSTNPLAPDLFSFTELGLSGDPVTVGQYWLAFSGALLVVVLLVLFVPVPELFGSEGPSDAFLYFVDEVLPVAGFSIVFVAFARGLYLVTRGRKLSLKRR